MSGLRTFSAIFLAFNLVGCGKSFKNDADLASGNVKVQIIAPGSIVENATSSLPYSFADVELLSIFDLVSISGQYARFHIKASRNENNVIGPKPRGQFLRNKEGVFIPKNFLTLQATTLYFHSQNMMLLERSLKLDSKRTAPLKIVLETPVLNTKQNENNAFYDGDLDAIIFLKYSEGNLPLSLNGGVFAHEYFHSIFERIVLKTLKTNELFKIPTPINKITMTKTLADVTKINLSSKASELRTRMVSGPITLSQENVKWYYALLLKGFNEGLADYWGWNYVNDVSFISHSLPQTRTSRKLDLSSQKLDSLQLLSEAEMLSIIYQVTDSTSEKLELINAFSYLLGSRIALFFKSYSETIQHERSLSTEETHKLVNQTILDFIHSLATTLPQVTLAADHTQLTSPYTLMYQFFSATELKTANECQFMKNFFETDSQKKNSLSCIADQNKIFKLTPTGAQ
ncbi:MAG: hypothetical protein JNL11_13185 [Bdellovibrionaceae bacterium]|nr:hypothetical protein [Pseudobdellovibrionaceae bacterium]